MKFTKTNREPKYNIELSLEDLKLLYCAWVTTGTIEYDQMLSSYFGDNVNVQNRRDAFDKRIAKLWEDVLETSKYIKYINDNRYRSGYSEED